MAEGIMLAWETSVEALELRRKFDEDDDEFEDDGFTFDDDEEDEEDDVLVGSERFLREIRTAARLQHPHILPVYDSGGTDTLLYYVMPLVEGESLRARLRREQRLPLPEVLRLAQEVGKALAYAHRNNLVHRDIKPENVLLYDGHAMVVDFGIAKAIQESGDPHLTQTGMGIGTPAYMSPEQA